MQSRRPRECWPPIGSALDASSCVPFRPVPLDPTLPLGRRYPDSIRPPNPVFICCRNDRLRNIILAKSDGHGSSDITLKRYFTDRSQPYWPPTKTGRATFSLPGPLPSAARGPPRARRQIVVTMSGPGPSGGYSVSSAGWRFPTHSGRARKVGNFHPQSSAGTALLDRSFEKVV